MIQKTSSRVNKLMKRCSELDAPRFIEAIHITYKMVGKEEREQFLFDVLNRILNSHLAYNVPPNVSSSTINSNILDRGDTTIDEDISPVRIEGIVGSIDTENSAFVYDTKKITWEQLFYGENDR